MNMNDQLYVPTVLPPGKEPPVASGYECGFVPRAVLDVEAKISPYLCWELNPRDSARSQSVTLLMELPLCITGINIINFN
jgi:hypothetical protein